MNLSNRRIVLSAIYIAVALLYIARLFYIQVIDDSYKLDAENNSRRYEVRHPARGLIYDRNGKLIVANEVAYDLMVVTGQIKNLDTLKLLSIINVPKETFVTELKKAKKSSFRPYPIVKQISAETYAKLQEQLFNFQGFYVQTRTVRNYPYHCGALVLGYISEVNKKEIDANPYYEQGDYIGKIGIEKRYEPYLRGVKGGKYYQVDVKGRVKGSFEDGKYDKPVTLGKNITTTLDIELQKYGEELMRNKKGSIVALDPKTGEILALVSAPTFDPNIMVGRLVNENYKKLESDPLKPLYNRPIQGDRYPPGSTFKTLNALIGLQEGIITPNTMYGCQAGYYSGGLHVGCHNHYSPINLIESIKMSCNAYYCNVFRAILDAPKYKSVREGFLTWQSHIKSFGLGDKLGIDLPSERPGIVPRAEYYDKVYGKNRWKSLTLISLSIGQGEITMTPLQMANVAATIANKGYYYTPHVVKEIDDTVFDKSFIKKHQTKIAEKYYDIVQEGMYQVVQGEPYSGATAWFVALKDISICGKTGTAQNPHGDDHSIFMAFAPREDPKIAISVYVENAGFGATWAAPIASLMIEKYLKGTITNTWREKQILDKDFIH
ncbi:MAG: penicillin-binding protein 2 [Bacteroidales bacterium]|nr:penicillin-binding protein 2 [Bacteroidales bacterium]MCR4800223.1 penicillin-binding protein 2 [Bacteroidales bacterium]